MSGGNGGSGGGSATGGVDLGNDCLKIYRGVRLSSPKSTVLSKLKVDDRLDLDVRKYKGSPILYAMKSGQDAGTVISLSVTQIVKCIEQGYRYIAIVKTLDGGDCTLEIRMETSS
jgi:hypothetical protein